MVWATSPTPPSPPPSTSLVIVTTSPLPTGVAGQPYSVTLAASQPGQWSVTSGRLPTGLTLAPNGVISGVPKKMGVSTFTVTVISGTATATGAFELPIDARQR